MITSGEYGVTYAVSTGCFMRSDVSTALRNGSGRLIGKNNLREVEEGYRAAEILGIDVELVFRPGIETALGESDLRKTVQVHAPIMYDFKSLIAHPYNQDPMRFRGIMSYGVGFGAMLTTMGDVKHDFASAARLASQANANLVMHPDAVRKLARNQPQLLMQYNEIIGEEADWPAQYARNLNAPLVWRDEAVMADIRTFEVNATPDTSHHLIAYNPAPENIYSSLSRMMGVYESTIQGVHVSAVVTNPNNIDTVYNGGGALPFNSSRIPSGQPEYIDAIRRFVDDLDEYAKRHRRTIPAVVEIYGWDQQVKDFDGRLRGVEATLNGLNTRVVPNRSISEPGRPTRLL